MDTTSKRILAVEKQLERVAFLKAVSFGCFLF